LTAAVGGETAEVTAGGRSEREEATEPLRWYAGRAAAFVEEHCPDDPEMLIAAGLLTRDLNQARRLLKSAVEKSGGGAAWAAYAQAAIESGPAYYRLSVWGVDPTDSEAVAEAEREIAGSGIPGKLTPDEAQPVLDVLRQWQQVEPENAVPLALETYYLYGLHRDEEALARWEEAAALAEVNTYAQEFIRYTARLLEQMGMSPWESVSNSFNSGSALGPLSKLRTCARIGVYEGRLAEMEGRDREAIRWWMATFRFGEHMQESADTLIEALIGIAIEGVGGTPVWAWQHDGMTGIPDGPLLKGRLFYGKSHGFFVREAGQQAADGIRDSAAKAKVRSMLAREYFEQLGPTPLLEVTTLRSFAGMSVVLLIVALLGFGAVSLWARRRADEATMLDWRGRLALTLIALVPLGGVSALSFGALEKNLVSASLGMLGGAAVSFLLLLMLPLAAAFRSRAPEARVLTAWRGNLRMVLPLAAVGLAVISLGFVIASRTTQTRWARSWMSETEIERVESLIGPEWENPTIPPDAWRNEPPPELETE
ncbi:MAG: hypothetical protein MUQ65_14515, partial [Armatimonadetes bacterium]|nr:hypothetical protein [Armatimonadota bacterium]